MMLLSIAGCKQSNAEQELAQLRDSLNNAKVEQQKLYDDSIKKVQEEQRQQAIADSIANAKKMEAAQADNYIREELRKYILDKKSKVVLTASAMSDIGEDAWCELQCPLYECPYEYNCGPLFAPSEGSGCKVYKAGKDGSGNDLYSFSAICPCGCGQRAESFALMEVTLSQNGNVLLQHLSMGDI